MSHPTEANAPIEFYDRSTGQVAIEEIYGEAFYAGHMVTRSGA